MQTQIRVTLPNQLQSFLQTKADKFGLSMAAYVRNLIINDIKDLDIPTYQMSKKTEENALQAKKDHQQGKTIEIHNVDKFLNNL